MSHLVKKIHKPRDNVTIPALGKLFREQLRLILEQFGMPGKNGKILVLVVDCRQQSDNVLDALHRVKIQGNAGKSPNFLELLIGQRFFA
jgi:hypothetical protein